MGGLLNIKFIIIGKILPKDNKMIKRQIQEEIRNKKKKDNSSQAGEKRGIKSTQMDKRRK